MKTLLAIAASVLITAGITIGTAKAGLWEKLSSLNDMVVETKTYTIEAKGWNLRAYSWKDPASGMYCIYVAGSKTGGLSCNPVDDSK